MIFILEAFFSGCISKVINDGKDYSWPKIKSVIKDRHDQNMSTKICRVIERALNIVTDNVYEKTDDLYDAIENIFNEFKNHGDTLESVKCGLNILGVDANEQRCENFLEKFYEGIRSDDDLYKAVMMDLELKDIKINQEEFQKLNEKLDNLTEIVSSRNDNENDLQNKEPVKSRTQEYADKWNQNMFLNDFSEWDEDAGVNVKLSDVYIDEHLPHFIYGHNEKEFDNIDVLLSKHIMKTKENKMLLILGQPGIGKSTLITWITVNFADRINDILIYRFASDLENIDWKDGGISNRVLEELGLNHSDLNGKILILDGFDEVNVEENRRRVLDNLYGELIYKRNINDFSLIITCRENYIQGFERVKCKYIILQPWNDTQIRSFCNIFQEKTKDEISGNTKEKLCENKEILGIPLILYMVLALNISIDKEGSIVDIYDKIFSLDGGIYDRCIDNKRFADKHRIGETKEQIHQISKDIAVWMFENKPEEANIPQIEYQKICNRVMRKQNKSKEIEQDFLIGNFFKLVKHCEGIETEELYFIHRSIYEYFVVETIFSSIEKAIMDLTEKSQEDLAKNIAFYLKEGKISTTIGEYLQHKIIKLYKKMDDEKKQRFYPWWESTVDKMMDTGMFYYTNRNIHEYKDIIEKEINCFSNLMEILRRLLVITDRKYILESVNTYRLLDYITLKRSRHNLSSVYLKDANLRGIRLHEFDLQGANLCNADLRGVDLVGANLQKADLQEADLRNAMLYSVSLDNANLKGAQFDRKQIIELEEYEIDLQKVKVFLEKEDCFISYEEYCKRKQRKVNSSSKGIKP